MAQLAGTGTALTFKLDTASVDTPVVSLTSISNTAREWRPGTPKVSLKLPPTGPVASSPKGRNSAPSTITMAGSAKPASKASLLASTQRLRGFRA